MVSAMHAGMTKILHAASSFSEKFVAVNTIRHPLTCNVAQVLSITRDRAITLELPSQHHIKFKLLITSRHIYNIYK